MVDKKVTATVEYRAAATGTPTWCVVVDGQRVIPFGDGSAAYDDALRAGQRFESGKESPEDYLAVAGLDKVLLPALCHHGCGSLEDECQCKAAAQAMAAQAQAARDDDDRDFHNMLARWEDQRQAEGIKVAA